MNWRTYFSELARAQRRPQFHYREPASAQALDALEAEFGVRLPSELRELLSQTDGVFDSNECAFVDGVAGILDMNRYTRGEEASGFMPLDGLFFVSSAPGNGDYVGYGLPRDGSDAVALYRWDHEDDSRQWQAPDLATWARWTLEGAT